MHTHCEIVMPPSAAEDIKAAVASVMKPFDENGKDEDGERSPHAFWDFYVIGGRFAGSKLVAKYDRAALDSFYEWLRAEKVTVSGLTCGKQEISPVDQIPKVDAKWNEMFPSDRILPCPLFKHSNDQYGRKGPESGTIVGDVCRLVDVPPAMEIGRVIVAIPEFVKVGKTYERTGPMEAEFMLTDAAWNGVNHMPIAWDGKLPSAIAKYRETLSRAKEAYRDAWTPKDDWIAVTVDYHS